MNVPAHLGDAHADVASKMLKGLTEKQVEVLDQLCLHKTSKEIANELGISRHTVDQRISSIRTKWEIATRKEVVRIYRELKETTENCDDTICEPLIYESTQVGSRPEPIDASEQDRTTIVVEGQAAAAPAATAFCSGLSLVDRLDLHFGPSGRFVAVVGLSFTMALTLVLVLEIADVLEGLL